MTEQHWRQIGSGLFRSQDGTATIAFGADGTLVSSQTPASAYEKLPWYQTPTLHLAVVGAAALVLLAAFFVVPIRAVVAPRAGLRPGRSVWERFALMVGWLVSASMVLFGGAFAIISSEPNRLAQILLTGDPTLSIALNNVSVMGVLTVVVVASTITAWVRRWWSVPGRVAYSVLALAAIAFVAVAFTYRLVGVPVTLTV